ncbi:DUF4129 domain-containing protein [Catenuloplanes atrovinosus]|uniref:Protein-glutamine gamma-glutamyltransferase-like C-terminal domain-containing protein n=1 Tax=Catenuloplanes atrovinosus TaxID=137266 RepID=A0AAE3YSX7_9ACTN|nr:DUF4129 domain-containing protein [Catenuloplanes atrovinosus]MDR7279304.1 hypothetical protein [Catenuloplanes atrovinosus]
MTLASVRRWWPVVAAVLLVGLIAFAAENSSMGLRTAPPLVDVPVTTEEPELEEPPPAAGGGGDTPLRAEDSGFALAPWLVTLLFVLGGVLVAAVIGTVAWVAVRDQLRKRQGVRAVSRRGGATEEMVAALDAGLQELATDRDPRGAVITCWVRLEQAAADAGTPRRPGDTPTELVSRLLREHAVDARVLAGFADVYREARYATHVVDERMRAQAVAALHRVRDDLTAPATGGGAAS